MEPDRRRLGVGFPCDLVLGKAFNEFECQQMGEFVKGADFVSGRVFPEVLALRLGELFLTLTV